MSWRAGEIPLFGGVFY